MVSKYKLLLIISILFSLFAAGYSINISSCQNINVSGDYTVNQSINALVPDCINISSSNITINCNQNTISASTSELKIMLFTNSTNVTITDCVFENGTINFTNSTNNYIYNNTFDNTSFDFDIYSNNNFFKTHSFIK